MPGITNQLILKIKAIVLELNLRAKWLYVSLLNLSGLNSLSIKEYKNTHLRRVF